MFRSNGLSLWWRPLESRNRFVLCTMNLAFHVLSDTDGCGGISGRACQGSPSRYVLVLAANGGTDAQPVREQLETAFQSCGLPEALLMDHGTPWWNQQSPSGRTKLSLWLMRQGIRLCWSGVRHPQTQGKIERFHG
jgi:hypothetical protein